MSRHRLCLEWKQKQKEFYVEKFQLNFNKNYLIKGDHCSSWEVVLKMEAWSPVNNSDDDCFASLYIFFNESFKILKWTFLKPNQHCVVRDKMVFHCGMKCHRWSATTGSVAYDMHCTAL